MFMRMLTFGVLSADHISKMVSQEEQLPTIVANATQDAIGAQRDDDFVPMHLAQSEVMIPAFMFLWVAIVRAHEIASLSGSDTLAAVRENKWYRTVVWAKTTSTRQRRQKGKSGCLNMISNTLLSMQRGALSVILCCTKCSCQCAKNFDEFSRELGNTDKSVSKTKLEFNLMDSDRRRMEELKRTVSCLHIS